MFLGHVADETRFNESGLFVCKECKKNAAFEVGRRTTEVKGKVRYLGYSVLGEDVPDKDDETRFVESSLWHAKKVKRRTRSKRSDESVG